MVRPLRKKSTKTLPPWLENAFGGVAWALGLIPLQEWADATPLPPDREDIRAMVDALPADQHQGIVKDIAALLRERFPPDNVPPAYDRGYRAHDRVMRAILLRHGDGDALLHAVMEHDADSLRILLKFPPAEVLDPDFRQGFEQANQDLAKATREALQDESN